MNLTSNYLIRWIFPNPYHSEFLISSLKKKSHIEALKQTVKSQESRKVNFLIQTCGSSGPVGFHPKGLLPEEMFESVNHQPSTHLPSPLPRPVGELLQKYFHFQWVWILVAYISEVLSHGIIAVLEFWLHIHVPPVCLSGCVLCGWQRATTDTLQTALQM